MKRLIRKAESELENFLYNRLYDWEEIDGAEKFLEENPDCAYTGTAYRVMIIVLDDIQNKVINEINWQEKNGELVSTREEAEKVIRELIRVDGVYCSFAKTEEGADAASADIHSDFGGTGSMATIKANVSGLDMAKLAKKYADTSELIAEVLPGYERYQEVMAPLPNDYEIVQMNTLKDFYLIYEKDKGYVIFND